ncbi:inactive serine/threonine-protein kinase VRK3 [Centropristis striata]|uniref:inactive serine/threonine-protein kinase VRK3 n=1 Tax=Centropristis striata TaxID=184440 RepID=UPI0027E1790E|nr:inactive serine/threonine-protein kinase VRK3 [Centropristis striata]
MNEAAAATKPPTETRARVSGVSGLVGPPVSSQSAAPDSPPARKLLRTARGKVKLSSPVKLLEESTVECSTQTVCSSPSSSPLKGKGKARKTKPACGVEPLQDGEEVTDTTGRRWRLEKLLSQSSTELLYQVCQTVSRSNSKESSHILKLGAKDGRIFTEQNFLQRAAKPATVEKWIKQNKMDFLGIPSCVGFGLHAESYRFLIFPNMGRSLSSIMEDQDQDQDQLLSERTVLQLACRILDVLQYLHSNEYVHADINAENIYIKPGDKSQVYLGGFCHSFRFCPGGTHVEYRESSRTPHEGAVEFISLDAHKGAAPSRRSDLQSLGFCMLRWHTGALPWTPLLSDPQQVANHKQRLMEDVPALLSLCFRNNKVPRVFEWYLREVMTLQYCEQPNYSELKSGLTDELLKLGATPEQPISF